jgi:hypothetical protein
MDDNDSDGSVEQRSGRIDEIVADAKRGRGRHRASSVDEVSHATIGDMERRCRTSQP